jgi:hypothetical protein
MLAFVGVYARRRLNCTLGEGSICSGCCALSLRTAATLSFAAMFTRFASESFSIFASLDLGVASRLSR